MTLTMMTNAMSRRQQQRNPRRPKRMTYAQVEGRLRKAITGARNLELDHAADALEELTVGEYAERRGWQIENPTGRSEKGGDVMAQRTRQELLDEIDDLTGENEELRSKLDQINAITVEEEPEDDGDDEGE